MSDDHAARPKGAEAADAAAARLVGAQARVVGASWSGQPGASGNFGALVFACGKGSDDGAGWIDIDLVPAGDGLSLTMSLTAERPEALAALVERGLVGVFVDGRELSPAPAQQARPPAIPPPPSSAAAGHDGLSVTMALRLATVPGQLLSLRLGLDDLGGAGPVELRILPAGSMPVAGPVAGGPSRIWRRSAAGVAGVGAAMLGAGPAEANGRGAVAQPDFVTAIAGQSTVANLLANDTAANINALQITHINGVAISVGQTVTLPSGHMVTLNADKTVTILAGPDTGTTTFTYRIAAGQGNGASSVGTVTLNVIPCFVAGTRIAVPGGERPVEALRPDDLVLTRDHGPQPLRWAGARRVAALGLLAPVRIAAGTFGAHRTLLVSPQHRILLRGPQVDLLFGVPEVLAAAKDLVDGVAVTQRPGSEVAYHHLLFDRHAVLWSEGLESESLLPGPQTAQIFAPAQLAEIAALFPAFDPATGQGYGPAARPLLRRFETLALRAPCGSASSVPARSAA
ncbi:MAG TPA: Hint domain-containing protein [Paracoccaceae bacterium]|nr:Hint domain-containing protein [Paracoccaceae bacterium]